MTKFVITDEAVQEWLTNEFEGSPLEPTLVLARECALAIINEEREEDELELLVRCPKEAAETTLSYIEDIAKEWNKELSEEDESNDSESSDEDSDEGKSIIKAKYKTRYRPFKMTCGDDISQLVTKHVTVDLGKDGKHVDRSKLEHFAKLNSCWDAKYASLNVGMVRMNVANRLRAKVRHGHEIVWN